jgi:hypothetical protein
MLRTLVIRGLGAPVAALGALTLLVHAAPTPPMPAPPVLPPQAGLSYDVRDADTGARIPCKLTLLGSGDTPTPRFTRGDIGRQEGDAIVAYNRIMTVTGVGVVPVPLGSYDVYVSRGPEWTLATLPKLHVTAKGAVVHASLRHVVDTRGFLSADLHVHAAASSDSHVPMHDRVYEFVSDGVEMIVSTDHNVVADYAPLIEELGVGRYLTSAAGDELTTGGWGHFGAFPLPQSLEHAGQGAILVHGRSARDFFADVRTQAPAAVIDVHHPRLDSEIGYFNLGRLNSITDTAERQGFSFDFDAVEVLNGYQDSERRSVDRVIDDWFALLEHGHIVTATGNSDTHHLDHNIGGYPRNYIRVQEDSPPAVKPDAIARAIKAHHALFSTAPFVRVHVGPAGIGDLAPANHGRITVECDVQAAPWVSVSRVTLYLNGQEVKRWPVAPSSDVVRWSGKEELAVTRDSFVVVRVDGDRPLAPVVGDQVHFDVLPLALTNPVFIDANGNGKYDPPQKHGPH